MFDYNVELCGSVITLGAVIIPLLHVNMLSVLLDCCSEGLSNHNGYSYHPFLSCIDALCFIILLC